MTTNQLPTEFTFSKSALNAACATFENDKNITLRDAHTKGLTLRKQARGWHFAVLRKINSKVHRVTIEEFTATSDLARIRAEAARIMLEIRQGEFVPAKARAAVAQVATDAKAMTLGDALELHARVNPQLRAKTLEEYARAVLWLTNTAPARVDGRADVLGTAAGCTLPIAALTTDDVRAAYDRLCNAGKIASGASMLRGLRAIWNTWADETEHDGRNPVLRITSKRGRVQRVAPRTGAIPPAEQAAWFAAMDAEARNSPFAVARACQFVFLTGLRKREALGLRWEDVDTDAGTITVAADRMKGGVALVRPITRGMAKILGAQRELNTTDSPWVFPARRGLGPVADVHTTLARVAPVVTAHDLRRTFIVAGALAGVPEVAVKMLVGHSTSDITETYARAIGTELPALAQRIENQLLSAGAALRVVA